MTHKRAILVITGTIGLFICIYLSLKYVNVPISPLTRAEAQVECEQLLHTVARHQYLDPNKFHLLGWRRYWMEPQHTPTWDFFYKTPENPRTIYWFVWIEEQRTAENFEFDATEWKSFVTQMQKSSVDISSFR